MRTDADGVRRDTLGRRVHDSRRGPIPTSEGERSTVLLQARIPRAMWEEVERRAYDKPGTDKRRTGSGRGGVVKEALEVLFYGDAAAWKSRYRGEMNRRAAAEARAQEADARAAAAIQRALEAERRLKMIREQLEKARAIGGR